MTHANADVAVIGAGISGLCTALALADAGLDVVLSTDVRAGEASPAAGGILDAGHGFSDPDNAAVFCARHAISGRLYGRARERTGLAVPLNREESSNSRATDSRCGTPPQAGRRADRSGSMPALRALEPHLSHAWARSGSRMTVPSIRSLCLKALKHAVGTTRSRPGRSRKRSPHQPRVGTRRAVAVALQRRRDDPACAWSWLAAHGRAALTGVPMHLPVAPVRGQLMSVASKALRHVVMLGDGLRDSTAATAGRSSAGLKSTLASTHSTRRRRRRDRSARLRPRSSRPRHGGHAQHLGRPATNDPRWPPDHRAGRRNTPSVLYACGHGRNGILLGAVDRRAHRSGGHGGARCQPTRPRSARYAFQVRVERQFRASPAVT